MPQKQYTEEEQQRVKKYRDLFDAKNELHKLMRRDRHIHQARNAGKAAG